MIRDSNSPGDATADNMAAVLERNVSNNRAFIDPCLRTYGLDRVKPMVDEYLESDVPGAQSGAERLQYWLREPYKRRGTF